MAFEERAPAGRTAAERRISCMVQNYKMFVIEIKKALNRLKSSGLLRINKVKPTNQGLHFQQYFSKG